jgi:hypothetical protein
MMSGIPLETCWAFNKRWNNKLYYKVASCWLFLLTLQDLKHVGRGHSKQSGDLVIYECICPHLFDIALWIWQNGDLSFFFPLLHLQSHSWIPHYTSRSVPRMTAGAWRCWLNFQLCFRSRRYGFSARPLCAFEACWRRTRDVCVFVGGPG